MRNPTPQYRVTQFDREGARSVPKNTGRPQQNRHALSVVGFVGAARFWGGQPLAPPTAKLSHFCPKVHLA
jgi:hypothetical protein